MVQLLPVPMNSWGQLEPYTNGSYTDTLARDGYPTVPGPREKTVSWSERSLEAYSVRYGSQGPYQLINGRRWAPVRGFRRNGFVVTSLGGTDIFRVYNAGDWWIRKSIDCPGYPTGIGNYRLYHPDQENWMSDNMENRLNSEVLAKVGKRQVNYGESIGEARETLRMLIDAVKRAVQVLLAIKRGQWSKVPRLLGIPKKNIKNGASFREGWLAYNYGWKPLVSDIYDSYMLFKKGFALDGLHVFSAIRNIKEAVDFRTSANSYYVDRASGVTTFTAKVFYRVSDTTVNRIHQLGLINPLEIAWALQPYSFVVDWFLPVGTFLEALSARFGIEFVDGYYGVRRTSSAVCRTSVNNSNYVPIARTFRVQTDFFSYERRKMLSLPIPSLYWKSPFSSSHLISALALIGQLRR